jgi:hypothetical protein
MDDRFRPTPCQTFSKVEWEQTRFGDPERYKMANGIVSSGKLLGMDEEGVRSLLGDPMVEQTPRGRFLMYELTPQRTFPSKSFLLPNSLFMNIDTWMLEIRCESGKVKGVRIRST